MNKTIFDSVLLNYKMGIFTHFYWQIDFHYTEFTDDNYWNNRDEWRTPITLHELNYSFNNFIEFNKLNFDEVVCSIDEILEYFILIKPTLKDKIIECNTNKLPFSEIREMDFDFDTNYNQFESYFKSELLLWKEKTLNSLPVIETNSNINNGISWENQTELSELIYVLFHSKRVLKNGKPIEIKDLTELFNKTFNTNIKTPTDLVNKSVKSYKKSIDGKTFISELNSILEVYKTKTLDNDSK